MRELCGVEKCWCCILQQFFVICPDDAVPPFWSQPISVFTKNSCKIHTLDISISSRCHRLSERTGRTVLNQPESHGELVCYSLHESRQCKLLQLFKMNQPSIRDAQTWTANYRQQQDVFWFYCFFLSNGHRYCCNTSLHYCYHKGSFWRNA